MEASAAQRLRELAGAIGSENHGRTLVGLQGSKLRHAYLEVGQQFEQKGLELLVGLVDLVDEQDDSARRGDRFEQRALEQIVAGENMLAQFLPSQSLLLVGLHPQELFLIVPF